ncbi:hypothetical protein EBK54_21395 [Salmonella enterica subsp. enterica]|uniref:Uncharacterized protein n=2 Tax=Salmonella enterica TaxID=28901 RepID=A0A6C8YIM5_SALER|nr:hypothetical protein [Salmonella enterica subsp. enterica serovar Abony]EAB6845304.1 hypothetical protein [Salmonella enterica subsp. salamae]EAB6967280.1 hypothetical protein [Salmonella enterica subsp. enterica serovar Kottbus]EAP4500827.1 hypothetical protein [Salmonella enterica]EBS4876507.1 hypothetical protein [Salmonella enterica subsp. enterica serovar Hvittingfoss]EBV0314192.1 hypothetical protein [Salmonella enterica subsp. enterica serovar Oranienburg]ECG2029220.1 hypothetical p
MTGAIPPPACKPRRCGPTSGGTPATLTLVARGIVSALQAIHGQTRAAGDVIKEAKLTHANCADLNNSIRMNLKIIQEQEDLNLAGLD